MRSSRRWIRLKERLLDSEHVEQSTLNRRIGSKVREGGRIRRGESVKYQKHKQHTGKRG